MKPQILPQLSREGTQSEGSKRSINNNNNSKLPSISSRAVPLAGGVPIYEVMKKLEIEKLLSREERIILGDILRDERYRDRFLNEIHQLELGTRQQNNVKRLKLLIKRHQQVNQQMNQQINQSQQSQSQGTIINTNVNNSITSNQIGNNSLQSNEHQHHHQQQQQANQNIFDPNNTFGRQGTQEGVNINETPDSITDTKQTLIQVVGNAPVYSEFANSGVLMKCRERLNDFISQYGLEKAKTTQFAVIIGSGSCNPVTRMHIRRFFIAKQCIESSTNGNMYVLGSLLSPSHPDLVRQRYRTFPKDIIPAPHRLAIAQLSVKDSIWVSVDPWEITRRRVMDYLSILEHLTTMIQLEFSEFSIKPLYLFKAIMFPNLSIKALKQNNYGGICVCRATEFDQLQPLLDKRSEWKDVVYFAEDQAILDASLDTISSKKVRQSAKKHEPLEHLVGGVVAEYFRVHHIGPKMNGDERWTEDEKYLPKILSSNPPPGPPPNRGISPRGNFRR